MWYASFLSILIFSTAYSYQNLGINLVDQGAFVNIINHTNRYLNAQSFDSLGWPESDFELVLMDNRPAREWSDGIDDPEEYRVDYSGTYKSSFKGRADVSLFGSGASIQNRSWDEASNTTYFELVIPGPPSNEHGFVYLTFSNTQRTQEVGLNSGITELMVMRPGYELDSEQIFTDDYIALCRAANFACYRYYTLQNIWEGEPDYPGKTIWDKRRIPADASQNPSGNTNGKLDGWCWEYVIKLANILNKDIWICIHISCDEDYVKKLAQMLKEELNPGINIYVENSNEVWSPTHMRHGPYNQAQAEEFGITFDQNYARRTVDLSNWFGEVFGSNEINKRIRVILAGQHAYNGRNDQHLAFINGNYGLPKDFIYALSTALYFGSTYSDGTPEEINNGMIESIDEQIKNVASNLFRLNHINKADIWELPGGCTSYEGGPHLPSGGNLDNLDNQILAHRTPKMKDIMKMNYAEGWFDMGGGLALQFTLSSGYNRYGCWGLTDDWTNPDRNYKMQAMRELLYDETDVKDVFIFNELKNYPNPASRFFTIEFWNDFPGNVRIILHNITGEKKKEVFNRYLPEGLQKVDIDISDVHPGIFFYRIVSSTDTKAGRLIIHR